MALRKKGKNRFLRRLAGFRPSPHELAKVLAVLVLAGAALLHLRSSFLAQLVMNQNVQMPAFRNELRHPDALASIARQEHLGEAHLEDARFLYKRALANYILHVPSWLGLAELYIDQGEEAAALNSLQFVHGFAADKKDTAWIKAILADQLDHEEIMGESLQWLAANHPGRRQNAFALADLRWPEPERMLERFAPDLYPAILTFYLRQKEQEKAALVWRKLEESNLADRDLALDYVNFLLRQDQVAKAARVWRGHYQDGNHLLYNSSFRDPFLGQAFGWRMSRPRGFTVRNSQGDTDLEIVFDGSENVSFHLNQLVPLPAGTYHLRGTMEAENLTTDQRPYWTVQGYGCEDLMVRETMLPANLAREKFSLSFTVPTSCEAVRISLRRNTSYYFDNKIAGTIRLTGLSLEKKGGLAESATGEATKSAKAPVEKDDRTEININRMDVY